MMEDARKLEVKDGERNTDIKRKLLSGYIWGIRRSLQFINLKKFRQKGWKWPYEFSSRKVKINSTHRWRNNHWIQKYVRGTLKGGQCPLTVTCNLYQLSITQKVQIHLFKARNIKSFVSGGGHVAQNGTVWATKDKGSAYKMYFCYNAVWINFVDRNSLLAFVKEQKCKNFFAYNLFGTHL